MTTGKRIFIWPRWGYVFSREVLFKLLDNTLTDFGKHVIPAAIDSQRVMAYVFQGYWEDIGTIRAYFEASLDLANDLPKFNFFDMTAPIFSRPRFLPASKINGAAINHAIVSDGCIISQAGITYSIVGVRSIIAAGSQLNRTIMLGCDTFESEPELLENEARGIPRMGVGRFTRIENTIIDKGARIGDNCVITPNGKPQNVDHPLYYIRDGIVIIPKNAVIPNGTVI